MFFQQLLHTKRKLLHPTNDRKPDLVNPIVLRTRLFSWLRSHDLCRVQRWHPPCRPRQSCAVASEQRVHPGQAIGTVALGWIPPARVDFLSTHLCRTLFDFVDAGEEQGYKNTKDTYIVSLGKCSWRHRRFGLGITANRG